MKQETMTITPNMARAWLKNIHPRDGARGVRLERGTLINKKHVEFFAKDITEGQWVENGVGITFGPEGELIDGVHRLEAVVKADKSIRSLVIHFDAEELNVPWPDLTKISKGRMLGPCCILTETQQRVMNAVRAGADVWHPYGRKGRWAYVNPEAEAAKPYCIQYRTLDALIALGLLKESAKGDDPDHHYELVK